MDRGLLLAAIFVMYIVSQKRVTGYATGTAPVDAYKDVTSEGVTNDDINRALTALKGKLIIEVNTFRKYVKGKSVRYELNCICMQDVSDLTLGTPYMRRLYADIVDDKIVKQAFSDMDTKSEVVPMGSRKTLSEFVPFSTIREFGVPKL